MTEQELKATIPAKMLKMFERLPIILEWCEFKGEIVVAQINYEESERVGRPMMDLSECMTRALNQNIFATVQWDKNKFKPCALTNHWNLQSLTQHT